MVLDLGWFQAVIAIDVMRSWAGGGSKFYVVLVLVPGYRLHVASGAVEDSCGPLCHCSV